MRLVGLTKSKKASRRSLSIRSSRLWCVPMWTLILWVCLWANLNSGFWNILSPSNANEWQLMIRAMLPFAVLPVAGFLLLGLGTFQLSGNSPSQLLLVYGTVAAIAATFSPQPLWS